LTSLQAKLGGGAIWNVVALSVGHVRHQRWLKIRETSIQQSSQYIDPSHTGDLNALGIEGVPTNAVLLIMTVAKIGRLVGREWDSPAHGGFDDPCIDGIRN